MSFTYCFYSNFTKWWKSISIGLPCWSEYMHLQFWSMDAFSNSWIFLISKSISQRENYSSYYCFQKNKKIWLEPFRKWEISRIPFCWLVSLFLLNLN